MSKGKDINPTKYYASTEQNEARMHRLVALRLRNAMLLLAYYNRGRPDDYGVFDIVEPHEEADALIEELRFFGFIPPAENVPEPQQSEGEKK